MSINTNSVVINSTVNATIGNICIKVTVVVIIITGLPRRCAMTGTNIIEDATINAINSMITNIDSITAEQSWRCAMTVAMSKKCRAAFQTRRRTLAFGTPLWPATGA